MDEYDKARLPIIKEFIGSIGEKYYFQGPIQFNYGTHTFIGNNFFANFNLMIMDDARIYIGDNVMFGPNVSLMATNHPLIAEERTAMKYEDGHVSVSEYADEIHIGNNVWIGAQATVLPGITIGDGAIVAAGAGASTKIVLPKAVEMPGSKKHKMTNLIRIENVKQVDEYIARIDEMIERKGEWLWH